MFESGRKSVEGALLSVHGQGSVRRKPWCKYGVIYKSVLLENLQYAANVALGFFAYFVFIYIYIRLWGYMYRSPGELIAGYTKEQMIWYVMMTEMLYFGSNAGVVAGEVARDIRGGNIAYLMNKPYHYTLYILARYTGEWSVRMPMYAVFAVLIGAVLVGPLPHFQWIYNKLILVVGILFPVEIFPKALQPLLKMTPIYTVCYGPAKLIVDFSLEKCVEILMAQAVYLAAGCALMFFIYGKGVRKLYVNGG